jgi:membrane protease YdiL (CAAX protease family)
MHRSPVLVVVVGFALFFVGQMFVQTALALLGLIYDGNAQAIMELHSQSPEVVAESASILKVAHIIGQFLSWGFAAWFGASLLGKPPEVLGVKGAASLRNILLGAVIILCATPLAQLLIIPDSWDGFSWMSSFVEDARAFEQISEAKTKAMLSQNSFGILLFNVFTFAFTPALCEELFFRGLIQRNLLRAMSPTIAIVVTALIFSLLHFALFGFVARAFLGVILGVLAWKSSTLWPAIAAHFVFNLSTVVSIAYGWDVYADHIPLWLTALTTLVMLLGISQ